MRKYVVHMTDRREGDTHTMFMIEKSNDEAAIRFVLDLDTPTYTAEDFEELVMGWRDATPSEDPFYMIFSIEDDKVIFE